jgi:dTDP-4-dehydrorhamnose reductase
MNVFVVGNKGYIGANNLIVRGVSSHPDPDMLHLDLSQPENFMYSQIGMGDVVLVTAAISSPDVCRDRQAFANMINVIGTGYFIERCLERDAKVVFFSSDTVYGPCKMERDERAVCYPAGEYAHMKREIESRFMDHPAFKTLRLSYVFSHEDKFTSYLTMCEDAHKVAEIFHPMLRRIIYLGDLLDLLKLICTSWDKVTDKVINVCGPELLSRIDIANFYRECVSPDLQYDIVEPPPDFFIARPEVINISNLALQRILGRSPRYIRDAMKIEFIKKDWL